MRILFLDDNPARLRWARREFIPGHDLSLVDSAAAATDLLGSLFGWDLVFLDHDLGGEEHADPSDPNTGSAVVRWVARNRPGVGRFIVHSLNAPAANGMVLSLREAGYRADYINFLDLVKRFGGDRALARVERSLRDGGE